MLLVPQRIDDRRFEERAKRELFRLSPTMPQIRLAPTAPSPQTDRRQFLPCRTPLGPDYEVGSLRHSNTACRLVASGINADVEPSERHVQEYADRKCDFLNITTAIVLRQGGEQPVDGANRSTPTLERSPEPP